MDKYVFIDKEYPVLQKAYTEDEIESKTDDDRYIEGVIKVSLPDLIDNDLENFLDFISVKLINSVCLMDIQYKIVGCCGDATALILVSGQPDY